MRTAVVHQLVTFHAPPQAVYEALMSSAAHSAFTGAPANIDPKVGGEFTAHGPYISGMNLALEPGRKIVQRWRITNWPTGHYSIVHFSFEPVDEGTLLRFMHQDIPSDKAKEIDTGWVEQYWKPLKKFLAVSAAPAKKASKPKSPSKKAKSKPKTKPKLKSKKKTAKVKKKMAKKAKKKR